MKVLSFAFAFTRSVIQHEINVSVYIGMMTIGIVNIMIRSYAIVIYGVVFFVS